MNPKPWRGTLIFAGVLTGVVLAAATRFATADEVVTSAGQPDGTQTSTTDSTSTSSQQLTGGAASRATQGIVDAVVVTGDVVQTRYGNVQVAATFSGTTLVDVTAVQHPTGHESDQINAHAIAVLTQEAVAANSAQIDTVSGATYTSGAYRQSLQSAIDQLG